MKKIFFALIISKALISCNKIAEVKPIQKNLLVKINDQRNGLFTKFEYDGENRLVKMSRNANANNPTLNLSFTYNTNGTLNEYFDKDSETKNRLLYNQNGTIKGKEKYEIRNGNEIVLNKYTYSYANGKVTELYLFTPTNVSWKQIYNYDTKNNLTEIESFSDINPKNPSGTSSGKIFYGSFDSKNHHYSTLPPEFFFPNKFVNNIGFEQYGESATKYKYTYEYNADGYPLKKIGANGEADIFEYKRL
jgi:hypothetical protein